MELDTGKVRHIGMVPNEKIFQKSLYGGMVAWGCWLVLVPLSARELAILDRETGECVKKIKLPGNEENGWKFADAAVCGNDMILIPACYPYFLSLNMIDFSVTVLQDWKKYLKKECSLNNQQQLTAFTVGKQGTLLFLQVMDTGYLLRFDMEKKRITKILHLPEILGVFALCEKQNIYIVPGKDGQVLSINAENGKVEKRLPMPITLNKHIKGHASVHGKIIGKNLVLFPQMASRISVIDLETGETDSYAGSWSVEINGRQKNIFQKIEMLDDRYAVALVCHKADRDYECFLIDTCDFTETCLKMHVLWDWKDFIKMLMEQCIKKNEMLDEGNLHIFDGEDILDRFLAAVDSQVARQLSENNRIGERIYQAIGKDMGLC